MLIEIPIETFHADISSVAASTAVPKYRGSGRYLYSEKSNELSFKDNEECYFTFVMPNKRDITKSLQLVLLWSPDIGTNTGTFNFRWEAKVGRRKVATAYTTISDETTYVGTSVAINSADNTKFLNKTIINFPTNPVNIDLVGPLELCSIRVFAETVPVNMFAILHHLWIQNGT